MHCKNLRSNILSAALFDSPESADMSSVSSKFWELIGVLQLASHDLLDIENTWEIIQRKYVQKKYTHLSFFYLIAGERGS